MADLEANFMHLQLMHESLSRFGESFASFLYGLNMRAFCVDFPEVRDLDSSCEEDVQDMMLMNLPGPSSRLNQAFQQPAAIS